MPTGLNWTELLFHEPGLFHWLPICPLYCSEKVWTVEATAAKRKAEKEKRETDKAAKVKRMRDEILARAPHHADADVAADLQPGNAVFQALDGQFLTIHTAQQQAQQQQVAATEN